MASDFRARWTSLRACGRVLSLAAAIAIGVASHPQAAQDDKSDNKDKKDGKRASLSLKANPPIAFSPAKVVVTAELKGGSDTDE